MPSNRLPDLVCPAGSLPALKSAVDNGADAVYLGFKNNTNARNFAGLNFDEKALVDGIRYAHDRKKGVLLAINTFPQAGRTADWQRAVDAAADLGVDAKPRLSTVKVQEPAKRKAGIKVADVADLVSRLRNEAKVIP